MSFILDALKKSESERQRADAPALYEMKMATPRRGVAVWLIALASLLVINVIVLSVVLLRGTHGTAQTDAAANATPPAAASPAAPAATVAPSVPAPANPTPLAAPATAVPDNASASSAASGDAGDDTPAIEPARGHGNVNPNTGSGEVPSYAQAASVPGANLPELKLDLHAYATNPADRFVFLNMTKLMEGQSTPAGVRVESITPDGAILSWQGSRFFLQRQ